MFVAVVPPAAVLEALGEHLAAVRRDDGRLMQVPQLRWTPPDQWHVTLAFLAAVPGAVLPDLTDRLRRGTGRRQAFETRITGAGAFSRAKQARVLWAGILDDEGALRQLADMVRAAASRAGLEVEGNRFRPHITLGRVAGRPLDLTAVVGALDDCAGPVWRVTEVVLVASHLGKGEGGRPRYERVAAFPLSPAFADEVRPR
ncbi:MAG: RNA 2',3'-cyclic phosphodiesterase [Actinomycetes bacterium]